MFLYDSTDAANIPSDAEAVAFYKDGIYLTWTMAERALFPHAVQITIVVFASDDGDALDVESYDATPEQAGPWAKRQGRFVWVYCNRTNRAAVEDSLHAEGLTPDQVGLWVATLDGTQYVALSPYGYRVCAVQYQNSILAGGHYDRSIIYGPLPEGLDDMLTDAEKTKLLSASEYAIETYYGLFTGQDPDIAPPRVLPFVQKIETMLTLIQELHDEEPQFAFLYTYSDGTVPYTDVTRWRDALAYAQGYAKQHPGVSVSVRVAFGSINST